MESKSEGLRFEMLDREFCICKVSELTGIDWNQPFLFIEQTDQELSIVCETQSAPDHVLEREDGWKGFRIRGTLDFSLVGVLAKIASALANAKVGIFVISTYNTDYIFVKKEQLEKAMQTLQRADMGLDAITH